MPMCLLSARSHLGKSISEKLMKLSWFQLQRRLFRSELWSGCGKATGLGPHVAAHFPRLHFFQVPKSQQLRVQVSDTGVLDC